MRQLTLIDAQQISGGFGVDVNAEVANGDQATVMSNALAAFLVTGSSLPIGQSIMDNTAVWNSMMLNQIQINGFLITPMV